MTVLRLSRRPVWLGSITAVVLLATLGTLVVGVLLKAECLTNWPIDHQPKGCYNDIQSLWHGREMYRFVPPYSGQVHEVFENGKLVSIHLGAGQIEYPVITGVFAWLMARLADDHTSYWIVTALALTPFAFLTSWTLLKLSGRRALLFALSPQLLAYAYLNWDLLPVAATVTAIWAWRKDRQQLAAVLLALGACAKIYPGFLLLPLVLQLFLAGQRARAGRVVLTAVLTAVVVNLPFMAANLGGWAAPFRMQSMRTNDSTTNSIWHSFAGGVPLSWLNLISGVTVVALWAAACFVGYRRWRPSGDFPWLQVGAAMISGYIVLGRVDSPQYGLWVAPFLVVVAVPPRWVAAFILSDLWLWLEWSWLWGTPHFMHFAASMVKAVVLVGLTVAFLRSPVALVEPAGADESGGMKASNEPDGRRPAGPAPAPTRAAPPLSAAPQTS